MIQLPENLDIDSLISQYPPTFKFNIDNFNYLISLILEAPSWDKDIFSTQDNTFVRLHSKYLQPIIRDYQNYLRYLAEVNVIEIDKRYVVGERSKSYSLKGTYQTLPKEVVITSLKLLDRINQSLVNRNEKAVQIYPYLTKWYNANLSIDKKAAYVLLEELYNESIAKGTDYAIRRGNQKYTAYKFMIDRLASQQYLFVVDESGHRLHTSLTNLKKEFRQFLSYNNQTLVSIDLSCSQPFLSTCLFNQNFYQSVIDDHRINIDQLAENTRQLIQPLKNEILQTLQSLQTTTTLTNYTLTLPGVGPYILPMFAKHNDHFTLYKDLVKAGQFYEYLQSSVEAITGRKNVPRGEVKQMCLTMLFSSPKDTRTYFIQQREYFQEIFPQVYEVFTLIKSIDYKTLAILLQNIESELILNRVAKRIAHERPELPIFTIHDSVCTTVNNEAYVESIMQEEITQAVGLTPHFKVEYWTKD